VREIMSLKILDFTFSRRLESSLDERKFKELCSIGGDSWVYSCSHHGIEIVG